MTRCGRSSRRSRSSPSSLGGSLLFGIAPTAFEILRSGASIAMLPRTTGTSAMITPSAAPTPIHLRKPRIGFGSNERRGLGPTIGSRSAA